MSFKIMATKISFSAAKPSKTTTAPKPVKTIGMSKKPITSVVKTKSKGCKCGK